MGTCSFTRERFVISIMFKNRKNHTLRNKKKGLFSFEKTESHQEISRFTSHIFMTLHLSIIKSVLDQDTLCSLDDLNKTESSCLEYRVENQIWTNFPSCD